VNAVIRGLLLRTAQVLIIVALCSMNCAKAQAQPGPIFSLRAAKSPVTYHIGEQIELLLSFSTMASGYCITESGTRRVWPEEVELFRVVPSDNVVPSVERTYDPYFDKSSFGLLMGGSRLSSIHRLSRTSRVVSVYLNDWVRFRVPGQYTLTVISNRVSRSCDSSHQIASDRFVLQSNPIEIRMLAADAAWSLAQQAEIGQTLDATSNDEAIRVQAARRLGYLDTDESTAAIAHRFVASESGAVRQELARALLESTWRDTAIRVLDSSLRAEAPAEVYDVLAALRVAREFQTRVGPNQRRDGEDYRRTIREREDRYNAIVSELRRRGGATVRP
jgi:hypothetical protein